jgi:hypothetical protein
LLTLQCLMSFLDQVCRVYLITQAMAQALLAL